MDEIEKYKSKLRARIKQLLKRIESGQASKEYVSFEVFASLFDAADSGVTHQQIKDAYTIEAWRSETLTVPIAIARCIFDGWMKYRSTDSSVSLGNAYGLEGGQGQSPVVKKNQTLDLELKRSNAVLFEKLLAEKTKQPFKLEAAYFRVAGAEALVTGKKVSPDTVKAAYKKHRKRSLAEYRLKHREVSTPEN